MYLEIFKNMFNKMDKFIILNRGKTNWIYRLRYGTGIAWNYLVYNATISDYFELRFFEKNKKEKQKYLTSKQGLEFAKLVDSKEVFVKLCSKKEMYKELAEFTKREQLYSEECTFKEFLEFAEKHSEVLYKPDMADCGKGIEKWVFTSNNIESLYAKFKEEPSVLDELVIQHSLLSKLNPSSVNTIRIFTLVLESGECEIIGAALRMGKGNTIIDNYSAGGLVASIDIDTGIIVDAAEDAAGRRYPMHPVSKIKIKGFEIPNWSKILEFVKECAINYSLKYVAWDIAVCENECVLIEANPNGMANTIQIAGAGGKKAQFEKLKRKLKNKERG
ncbi:MAG: sugar-transfer associated ATP-grasp domain-containing protein [Bacillota bacterium]|nr:sugar-transfer associated ATP-grasp domain-containing protein [Bacillota bacterium]